MNEKQALIRETAQKFEALRPDMQQFVLGYLVARQNTQAAKRSRTNPGGPAARRLSGADPPRR